jgi:hypothetical protein
MGGYQNVSGLPGLSTVLTLLVIIVFFGASGTALLALPILLIDTGGPIWFLIMTWRDESLWDAPTR